MLQAVSVLVQYVVRVVHVGRGISARTFAWLHHAHAEEEEAPVPPRDHNNRKRRGRAGQARAEQGRAGQCRVTKRRVEHDRWHLRHQRTRAESAARINTTMQLTCKAATELW